MKWKTALMKGKDRKEQNQALDPHEEKGKANIVGESNHHLRSEAHFVEDGNDVAVEIEINPRDAALFESQEDEFSEFSGENNNAVIDQESELQEEEIYPIPTESSAEEGEASDEDGEIVLRTQSTERAPRKRPEVRSVVKVIEKPIRREAAKKPDEKFNMAQIEEKIDSAVSKLSHTLNQFMENCAKANAERNRPNSAANQNSGARPKGKSILVNDNSSAKESSSEVTIYDRAVKKEKDSIPASVEKPKNRQSSSSDELIDTSDELLVEANNLSDQIDINLNIIAEKTKQQQRQDETGRRGDRFYEEEPRAGSSRQCGDRQQPVERTPDEIANDRADQLVRQAEASKARILDVPGKLVGHSIDIDSQIDNASDRVRSVDVDEDYLVVGNYVDDTTRERIENGEYVDFSRLLPRDRLQVQEDNRMEIVNRDGRTFFVPANSGDSGNISNFSRWEQAFRVFSNIYTRRFPSRSAELIQYNHIIHTAALTFTWENVYLYDRDFRLHLSRYPQRSWAIILQQAWTMRLKDRNGHSGGYASQGKSNEGRSKNRRDVCWRYNRGRCSFGASCKFEHKCAVCGKFGHGVHICRKANGKDRDRDFDRDYDRHDRHDRNQDRHDRNDKNDRNNKRGRGAQIVN